MKYDIKYAFRKYQSEGKEKTVWTTHGTLFIEDDGKMKVKLDSVPVVPNYDGWYQVFKQETKEEREQRLGKKDTFEEIKF